jgi:hypothetical protein
MRFKAMMTPEQVSLLYSLVLPLSRLSGGGGERSWTRNGSLLYLDPETMRLSCKGRTQDTDGITCFAELNAKDGIFLQHRIESAASNVIVMELDLAQLRTALKSIMGDKSDSLTALDQPYTVLKLAKRQNIPCLCLDACSTGGATIQGAFRCVREHLCAEP